MSIMNRENGQHGKVKIAILGKGARVISCVIVRQERRITRPTAAEKRDSQPLLTPIYFVS